MCMNIGDIVKIRKNVIEDGLILGYDEEERFEIIGFSTGEIFGAAYAYLRSVEDAPYEDALPLSMIEKV